MNILTIPNILSLLRMPILFIVIYFIKENKNELALFFLLLAVITDILDGYIARKKGQETTLGRILDHVIDKIFFNSIAFSLYIFRKLPLYFVLILLIKDSVSLLLGYMILKRGKIIGSNFSGKLAGFSLSLLFVFYLFDLSYKEYLLYISLFLVIFASFIYLIVFMIFWIQTGEIKKAG